MPSSPRNEPDVRRRPRVVDKHYLTAWAVGVTWIACFAVGVWGSAGPGGNLGMFAVFASAVLAFFAHMAMKHVNASRIEAHDYSLCPCCHYDLRSVPCPPAPAPLEVVCPECGVRHDLNEVRGWWMKQCVSQHQPDGQVKNY